MTLSLYAFEFTTLLPSFRRLQLTTLLFVGTGHLSDVAMRLLFTSPVLTVFSTLLLSA